METQLGALQTLRDSDTKRDLVSQSNTIIYSKLKADGHIKLHTKKLTTYLKQHEDEQYRT